ncbi:MAG: AAA family ATPase [Pyrinomonadaceae bacterium]
MKLILIYGSPAVGKLTVAREIAKRTNFKVFHNHLTIDAVTPVFEFGTEPFGKLVSLFRAELIAEAARRGVDLIYTFCYAKDLDDSHIERIAKIVEENGGEIFFVMLTAEKCEIEKRIQAESRLTYTKMKDVKMLNEIWEKHDLFSPVPKRESLIIDNTFLSAEDAAEQIIEHFKL